jgi:hypothetical protein
MILSVDFLEIDGRRRVLQVQAFEVFQDDAGNREVPKPFSIRWDDEPGAFFVLQQDSKSSYAAM